MTQLFLGLFLALFASALLADELIIFHMPGCLPCNRLKRMLDENPELLQGFDVSMIDVVKDGKTAKLFQVSTVPTIVRLDAKTREIARHVGFLSKQEMSDWLDEHTHK